MSILFSYLPSFPTRRSSDLVSNDVERVRCALYPLRKQLTVGPNAEGLLPYDSWGIGFYQGGEVLLQRRPKPQDRESTRLNSSHLGISYAVLCLKKKIK